MGNGIKLIILLLMFSVNDLYTQTRQNLSLNGEWEFTPVGESPISFNVPGEWLATDLGDVYEDFPKDNLLIFKDKFEGSFEKSFDVPKEFANKQIILKFESINFLADIYINGKYITTHLGGFVPFEIDITNDVTVPSDNNLLKVDIKQDSRLINNFKIDDIFVPKVPVGWYGHYVNLGITGNVSICAYPKIRIKDVFINTSYRQDKLKLNFEIINYSQLNRTITIENKIYSDGYEEKALGEFQFDIDSDELKNLHLEYGWNDLELWMPNNPKLYSLVTTLKMGSTVFDSTATVFGFREVWHEGHKLYLNGIRINLRGDSNSLFSKTAYELFWTPNRENWEYYLRKMQNLGINVIRFHHSPPPSYVFDVCDQMGMLAIDESAIYSRSYLDVPVTEEYFNNCVQWIKDWIYRDRNHPSIIFWSAENEMHYPRKRMSFEQLAQLGQEILKYDDSRPIIFEGDRDLGGRIDTKDYHYIIDGPNYDWVQDIYQLSNYADLSKLNIIGEFTSTMSGNVNDEKTFYRQSLMIRGFRYAEFADIRPYNLLWAWFEAPDYLAAKNLFPTIEHIDHIKKSLSGVAVFDKWYDTLGEYPDLPVYESNGNFNRTFLIYNDAFQGKDIEIKYDVIIDDSLFASNNVNISIELGYKAETSVSFKLPANANADKIFTLAIKAYKDGIMKFEDFKHYILKGQHADESPPTIYHSKLEKESPNSVTVYWETNELSNSQVLWDVRRNLKNKSAVLHNFVKHHFVTLNQLEAEKKYFFKVKSSDPFGNFSVSQLDSFRISDHFFSISGHLGYYDNNNPISGVTLNLLGDSEKIIDTGSAGVYSFENLSVGGNYEIYASKMPDSDVNPFDITTYDAAITAQAAVRLRTLSSDAQLAADVSRDDLVGTYDAALIARYSVGLPRLPDSHVGEWTFIPAVREYQNLSKDFQNQDFRGVLLGNVHGGWQASTSGNRKVLPEHFALPDLVVKAGEIVELPLVFLGDKNTISFDISVRFDSMRLKFTGIKRTGLSEESHLFSHVQNGELRVGAFQTHPFQPMDEILRLQFRAVASENINTNIVIEKYRLNDTKLFQARSQIKIVSDGITPKSYHLSQNYPNPFVSGGGRFRYTKIKYAIPERAHVRLEIFNSLGQLVNVLVNEEKSSGFHHVNWDGKNRNGELVSGGIYFYRLKSRTFHSMKKILILK
ncbi:MAG: T9SS type A sorting domain-containing protein [Calditrichaeota bacterium]|nr:T9SS type A sorting domain-containing protein [Calditrichota bacterium]